MVSRIVRGVTNLGAEVSAPVIGALALRPLIDRKQGRVLVPVVVVEEVAQARLDALHVDLDGPFDVRSLDLVIEAGNPADTERFLPMLERHIAFYGKAPRQGAADGGYASRDNLNQAKALGVRDMAFHKKKGLRIEAMVRSNWVYRKLRNFRAGVEANISCLKRAYGLGRCTWRGLRHFEAYVWSSAVAYNLALFARLRPT